MDEQTVMQEMAKPIAQQLLASGIPGRLAYTGVDGDPRVVPVVYSWENGTIVVCTVVASAKVKALTNNPRVALTIDTEGFPPRALLVRGSARIEIVDGVPDVFVRATAKGMSGDMLAEWEAGVRALYQQTAVITITPHWAKLLDFETTIPKAVADLVAAHGDPR